MNEIEARTRTASSIQQRPAPPGSSRRWRLRRWVILLPLAIVAVFGLVIGCWIWITLHYSYSTGERSGYVQKISKKGWVCKTWEGELAMLTQPGVPAPLFNFSVRDESVAQRILNSAGNRV